MYQVDQNATLAAYPEVVLDYNQLGNVKLDPFNLADIRFDKNGILNATLLISTLKFKISCAKRAKT